MSITVETQVVYHVVGTRANGERVVISEIDNLKVAERIVMVMEEVGDYADIFIERGAEPLSPQLA